jgi:hypothetical protein
VLQALQATLAIQAPQASLGTRATLAIQATRVLQAIQATQALQALQAIQAIQATPVIQATQVLQEFLVSVRLSQITLWWQEEVERINWSIRIMGSHGSHPLLEMRYLHHNVMLSHGTGLYGSLEVKELIKWPILPME